jgi:hypothetical protein
VPAALVHRLAFAVSGTGERVAVTGARTTVTRRAPIRVTPPLRVDGVLGIVAHAPVTIGGRLSHAQRYAIDFGRLSAQRDGLFTGDPQRNDSYAIHGAEVVAAADGAIASVRDGQPETTPPAEPPFTSFDDVAGNRVVQDLGGGRYASTRT